MPLIEPPQTTVDLSSSVPGGWTLVGFSEPRSDGINPFRVPQPVTEIRFSTPGPRYVQFNYQLYSPNAEVKAKVTLDGQPLGQFTFPAGQFVTVNPAGFVKIGSHVLRFEQGCAQSCAVNQYQAGVTLISSPPAQRDVALGATRWYLNAPPSGFTASGLSSPAFDGVNFFRTLNRNQTAILTLPPGSQTSILRYQTISATGDYRLEWRALGGRKIPVQVTQDLPGMSADRPELGATILPKGQYINQNLSSPSSSDLKQLSLNVTCRGGGTACLPLKLYHVELTSLSRPAGLSEFTAGERFGIGLGLSGSLLLFALLLRPARARR
jgi:hypothetical protein